MNMPTVPKLLRLRGNESATNKLFLTTEALPTEARHENLLLSFCLIRLPFPHPPRQILLVWQTLKPMIDGCGNSLVGQLYPIDGNSGCSTDQHEVHAVVVDMPQRASLEYASPDTWGALPTFDPPDEESPTKPVLQVALN